MKNFILIFLLVLLVPICFLTLFNKHYQPKRTFLASQIPIKAYQMSMQLEGILLHKLLQKQIFPTDLT